MNNKTTLKIKDVFYGSVCSNIYLTGPSKMMSRTSSLKALVEIAEEKFRNIVYEACSRRSLLNFFPFRESTPVEKRKQVSREFGFFFKHLQNEQTSNFDIPV